MAESILSIITNYWFWGSVGFIVGSILGVRNMLRNGCPFPVAVIAITIGIYFGAFGTRILWILIFSPRLFLDNLPLALAFWQQTGTWLGAPVGGAIGIFLVLKIAKKPFWTNTGSIAPGLALTHAIARIGCLCAGCCYGAPTSVPWAIYSKKLNTMVHPTAVYSMIGEVAAFAILQVLWKKPKYRKFLYSSYVMLLATHRFISGFFRGDNPGPEIISGLRVYQTICIFLFVASLGIFMILKHRRLGPIIAACLVVITALAVMFLRPTCESELVVARQRSKLYLVVTRSCFAETIADWKAERTKDGFTVVAHGWKTAPSTAEIRDWIKEQTQTAGGFCSYILIVGDCADDKDEVTQWHIPSVKHTFQHSQESIEFIADALYGDLDGDGCPEVPVGRLAVQNTLQLKDQIDKILVYKYQTPQPAWFRVIIWAGAEGYTSQMSYITTSLTNHLPKWMDRFTISADLRSAYSGYPPDQPRIFLEQLSQPALFSVVASHGSFRSITVATYQGEEIFLSVEDVAQLKSQRPSGGLFLLACDSGRFNMPKAQGLSLAEAFTAHPGGPIGVVAATAPTNPLTNYFVVSEMIRQLTYSPDTIGDFLLGIQRRLYQQGKQSFSQLAQNDELAMRLLQAVPNNERYKLVIPELARYEVLMYNLLGDPCCKLKLPSYMPLSIRASSKGEMVVTGQTPSRCSELFVEMVKGERESGPLISNPSRSERRERFEMLNQQPEKLLQEQLSDRKWKVRFFVPCEYFGNKDYLRFIAIGRQRCYIGLHGVYREKPFADKFKEKR